MIAEIGIMIGFYIITRYCSFLGRQESMFVKAMSVFFMIITVLIVLGLIVKGLTGAGSPR
jgi:hypothetical protein